MRRPIYGLILFLSIFFLPWWAFVLLGLVGCAIFNHYYEAPVAGFIFDLVYGFAGSGFLSYQFTFTILGLLLMFLIEESKSHIRYYKR